MVCDVIIDVDFPILKVKITKIQLIKHENRVKTCTLNVSIIFFLHTDIISDVDFKN
jgi:hypothetical protein